LGLNTANETAIREDIILLVILSHAAVALMGERRDLSRVLVGKPEGKKPLGRPRCRWKDYVKMHLQEVGCGGVDWIMLAQNRDRWQTRVNAVMKLLVS
jgi:hypothetical protein